MAHGTGAARGEQSELRPKGEPTEREREWDGKKTGLPFLSLEAGGAMGPASRSTPDGLM